MTIPRDAAARSGSRAVGFQVGDATVTITAADVAIVVRCPKMIRVPHASAALCGLANLRGVATPVFSLAALLGRPQDGDKAWVVVLNQTPTLGLLVDGLKSLSDGGPVMPGTIHVLDGDNQRSITLAELTAGHAAAPRPDTAPIFSDLQRISASWHEGKTVNLLTFTSAGQNYALPLAEIIEVASLPKEMPAGSAEAASLGSARIRDMDIELVSVTALLGFDDTVGSGDRRVVVVDRGDRHIGLVVTGARTILRIPEDAIGAPPALVNRDSDVARIHRVLRMPDGRGVVSVLTLDTLFASSAPSGGEEKQAAAIDSGRPAAVADTSRFVIFRVGEEAYGYPIEAIGEIARRPDLIAPVPGAPSYVVGTFNLRGKALAVLDQRRRFGMAPKARVGAGRLLVVDIAGVPTGLLVDGVTDVRQVDRGQISIAPELPGRSRGLFDRVIMTQPSEDMPSGDMILVVDPDKLLSRSELDQLADFGRAGGQTAPS